MRRKLSGAVIAVLLLAMAHTAYWYYLRHELAAEYARWADNTRQSGFNVTGMATTTARWPFSVELVIRDLAIEGGRGAPDNQFGWSSPETSLRLALSNPYRLEIVPAGVQRLRAGAAPEIMLEAKQLQASMPFGSQHTAEAVDLAGSELSVSAARDQAAAVKVGTLLAHCDLTGTDDVAFTVDATAITLPDSRKWPLGNLVSSSSVAGKLIGRVSEAASLAEEAVAWRDSGGALEVQRLAFNWGSLGVTAGATLALDDQLQPMGTGSARLIGYPAALDALAANGTLSRSAVVATKAILSLLSSAPGDNEAGEVEVPLTLQYRTLSIRQVPLVRLPEVDWGPR